MKEIFALKETKRPTGEWYKLNLEITDYNQVKV